MVRWLAAVVLAQVAAFIPAVLIWAWPNDLDRDNPVVALPETALALAGAALLAALVAEAISALVGSGRGRWWLAVHALAGSLVVVNVLVFVAVPVSGWGSVGLLAVLPVTFFNLGVWIALGFPLWNAATTWVVLRLERAGHLRRPQYPGIGAWLARRRRQAEQRRESS